MEYQAFAVMSICLKIVFAGTPDFAVAALDALMETHQHEICAVYTQPDRPAGRGRKLKASPVKIAASEYGLPVYQPVTLNDPEQQQQLRALQADLMVVVAYGLLLPLPVLDAPRLGCINIHASLLPRWRGAAPIQRAILAGDSETGVTIMQMDEGLDTGPALYRLTTPISGGDTAQTLHDRLATLGAQALLDTLGLIVDGAACPVPQDEDAATYARKLDKSEAVLDWVLSAQELDRRVRAFNPWPVAQTLLHGKVLRVWQTEPLPGEFEKEPGTVLQVSKQGIDVATGDGILRLQCLQSAGGKLLDAGAFINGHPELRNPGIVLGL